MGPAQLNERESRNGLRPLSRTIAAGIVVLFLSAIGTYIWNLHTELEDLKIEVGRDYVLMAVHRADLERLDELLAGGEKFTLERGEGLEEDLRVLTQRHESLKLEVSENKLVVARMPHSLNYPFTTAMREKLTHLEKGQAINAERINNIKRTLNIRDRHLNESLKNQNH